MIATISITTSDGAIIGEVDTPAEMWVAFSTEAEDRGEVMEAREGDGRVIAKQWPTVWTVADADTDTVLREWATRDDAEDDARRRSARTGRAHTITPVSRHCHRSYPGTEYGPSTTYEPPTPLGDYYLGLAD